ncbi:MAG: globin family protein [Pseudomonadota bacterium]
MIAPQDRSAALPAGQVAFGPEQHALVTESFRQIQPISGLVAELFYARLFAKNPELQSLFKGEMAAQGAKLMQTLALVVDGLDRLETVLPYARDLAARHVTYGVTPAMYAPVGEALIFTLARSLDEGFTDAHRAAWETAYAILSEEMVRSAYAQPTPAHPSLTTAAE